MSKVLGMTVLPEWAQVEGVEAVLDNLQGRAGVNAIATSPYVMTPADEATGTREPPADAGAVTRRHPGHRANQSIRQSSFRWGRTPARPY